MARRGTLRAQVEEALRAERERRRVGVADGLCGLEDLAPFRPAHLAPDGSVPILAPPAGRDGALRRRSASEYRREAGEAIWRFFGRVPKDASPPAGQRRLGTEKGPAALASSSLERGFVVAGGAPASVLTGQRVRDIDVFLVGLAPEAAEDFVRRFPHKLKARLAGEQCDLRLYRTARCVTALAVDRANRRVVAQVQLILRRYSTVSEVLHGFDLGASKVADDGARLYFSAEGRLAFERGVNVVHPDVRRASYEARLLKYRERGFGTALPELAWPTADPGEPTRLPFLQLGEPDFDRCTGLLTAAAVRPLSGPLRESSQSVARRDPLLGERRPFRVERWSGRRGDSDGEDESDGKGGSEYEPAGPAYYRRDASELALDNVRAGRLGVPDGLCLAAAYSPLLDITAAQLRAEDLACDLAAQVDPLGDGAGEHAYVRAFGPGGSGILRAARLAEPGARLSVLRAAIAPYAGGDTIGALRIPFALAAVDSATAFALSSRDGRVSAEEWYGRFHARRGAGGLRLWAALLPWLLPVLADLALDYMGKVLPAEACPGCGERETVVCARGEDSGEPIDAWCLACCAELTPVERGGFVLRAPPPGPQTSGRAALPGPQAPSSGKEGGVGPSPTCSGEDADDLPSGAFGAD